MGVLVYRNMMYVGWTVLFCVLLLVLLSSAVDGDTGSQHTADNRFSGLGGTIFLIIHPSEIILDSTGLLNPGIFHINEQEYLNQRENMGLGKAKKDQKNQVVDEPGITGKAKDLADEYDPKNPTYPVGKGVNTLFNQADGVEDTLAGSFFDPTVDRTGNLVDSLTDTLDPTGAKGTSGTILSPKGLNSGNTGQMHVSGFGSGSWIFAMGDENPAGTQSYNDGWVSDYTPEDQSASDSTPEDQSTSDSTPEDQSASDSTPGDQSASDNTEDQSANDSTPEEQSKTYDDGSGTSAGDPNSMSNRLSGVAIKQKDNLDQVANDGGASSTINKKYKWLIDASKQPGFFVPESGGYKPGDTGLGRDVGIFTSDRTDIPRVNTERKVPWYLQPMALPKDLGFIPEAAAASEGESRTYQFSEGTMMASPEAIGGLKTGDLNSNTAGGGPVLHI